MIRVSEKNTQRHKVLAHSDHVTCHFTWMAKDEDDFCRIIDETISAIPAHEIWDMTTAEALLWKVLGVGPQTLITDPEMVYAEDARDEINYGEEYGWQTPLYRADFDEDREEGMYNPLAITRFQAYKKFLEYVSPGVTIEILPDYYYEGEEGFHEALKKAIYLGKQGLDRIDTAFLHRGMLEEKVAILEKMLFEVEHQDHFGAYGESRHD